MLDDAVTTTEAAHLACVTTSTIRDWASRGYIQRDGTRAHLPSYKHGRTRVYLRIDVAKAEYHTRHRARRTPAIPTP